MIEGVAVSQQLLHGDRGLLGNDAVVEGLQLGPVGEERGRCLSAILWEDPSFIRRTPGESRGRPVCPGSVGWGARRPRTDSHRRIATS